MFGTPCLIHPHSTLFKQNSFINLANNGKIYNYSVYAFTNVHAKMYGDRTLACNKPLHLFYIPLIRKAHTYMHTRYLNLTPVELKYIVQVCWQVILWSNSARWRLRRAAHVLSVFLDPFLQLDWPFPALASWEIHLEI